MGALQIIAENAQTAQITQAQLGSTVRGIYSMPPAHGAAIVELILGDTTLYKSWDTELSAMRNRINNLRESLSNHLSKETDQDFTFIKKQRGMFSFLGINETEIKELKKDFGVYMVDSSRINVAGINDSNLEHFIESLARVIKR